MCGQQKGEKRGGVADEFYTTGQMKGRSEKSAKIMAYGTNFSTDNHIPGNQRKKNWFKKEPQKMEEFRLIASYLSVHGSDTGH